MEDREYVIVDTIEVSLIDWEKEIVETHDIYNVKDADKFEMFLKNKGFYLDQETLNKFRLSK